MSTKPDLIQADRGQDAVPLHLVTKNGFDEWAKGLKASQRAALAGQKFEGGPAATAIVPDGDAWFAVGGVADPEAMNSYCLARLAEVLPAGIYRLEGYDPGPAIHGWQTAQHSFTRYKSEVEEVGPRILLSRQFNAIDNGLAEARAVNLVCDLVNTPAEDMGPAALEDIAAGLAKKYGGELTVTQGELLARDYPMIHAVGRAAARSHAPRLIELTWGDANAPRLAIVGKGVCFDSGGLDVKSSSGMLLMKKDMGGAAHALALAELIMGAGLPVRLHLLIPAVENAISGNSFRPGDVLNSRKGLTVEIGNTDAEGRLVLGDALTKASEEYPRLIIDFATLTGAARTALGPDYPALMTRRDDTAQELIDAGAACDDPPWRMPLPEAYADWLKSDIADVNNTHSNPYAGASVAGLFLDKFVGNHPDGTPIDWAHFDTFAWRPFPKPGRPKGGAAYGLRAAFRMVQRRFGNNGGKSG